MQTRIIPSAKLLWLIICLFLLQSLQAQEKQIKTQTQAWISVNNTVRLTSHWGFVADVHVRRNNFFADPSFFFIRGGMNYWLKDNITATLGYARMWVAPTVPGWHHFAVENRFYQQFQVITKTKRLVLFNRLRNEQRWQQKIVADNFIHQNKFTDRIRYLLSANVKVLSNKWLPSPVVSDEIAFQFGKEVIYNTFDQNRAFVGLKQNITKDLSADIGYMWLYQQLSSGYQYYSNKTFRLFFYFMPDWRRKGGR
ncbi:MAG: DUF2490 domain-containing protein [Bacteroidetes bacterium]|nr:DUF2490 domain-containing protein [Bacteroidota bacterium]